MKHGLAIFLMQVALVAGTATAQELQAAVPTSSPKKGTEAKQDATIRRVNPPTLSKPTGYTHVVIATGGRTIYIAGQTAVDKDGNVVGPGDFRAQAKQIFENLRTALAAAGAGFGDIVKLNIYVLDMTNAAVLREVRDGYLGSNPPAATLVEVKKLAREQFMLEIEAIAVTAK
jgi:enamine deaminase RidA (YjgF/YER057c/UK114 family)